MDLWLLIYYLQDLKKNVANTGSFNSIDHK